MCVCACVCVRVSVCVCVGGGQKQCEYARRVTDLQPGSGIWKVEN